MSIHHKLFCNFRFIIVQISTKRPTEVIEVFAQMEAKTLLHAEVRPSGEVARGRAMHVEPAWVLSWECSAASAGGQ